jgi:hypothetical protein
MAVAEAVRPEQLDLPTPPSRPARPRPWTPSAALIRPTPRCPQHSGAAELRRFYRHPTSGALVAMESHSRCFPKGLAKFIGLRDLLCRTPYCDAPIRRRDHAQPRNRGGPTSAINGLGECERCNYTKEAPGWRVSTTEENGVHSRIHDPYRRPLLLDRTTSARTATEVWVSEIEIRIGIAIAAQHAA